MPGTFRGHWSCFVLQMRYRIKEGSALIESAVAKPSGLRGPHLLDITMFWSPSGGGVARYIRSKRAWLHTHSNWRHTIITPGLPTAETSGFNAPALPLSGGYRFPLRRNAATRAIMQEEPDLIEAGDPYRFAWAALDAGQQLGIPVAAFYHSNLDALIDHKITRAVRPAVRRYLHHLYSQYDTVFAASHWSVDTLRNIGLSNVVLQPLGVDCELFHPRRRDEQWRAEVGFKDSDVVLLYAGRFAPEKNLDQLAAAVAQLGAPYVLAAIGDGPRPPSGTRVRILPYQAQSLQLARALASADVFVHAGDQETFGLAPLEALACGTPAIVRARGGLRDLIDGHAAVGVERDGCNAFAETIREVAPHALTLRDAARRRACEFDADRAFSQLLHRYTAMRCAPRFGAAETNEQRYAA